MVNVSVDLSQYKEITRRDAMLSIGAGEKVIGRLVRKVKADVYEISTMEDLSHAVNMEQKGMYDKLELYKEKTK